MSLSVNVQPLFYIRVIISPKGPSDLNAPQFEKLDPAAKPSIVGDPK